MSIHRIGLTSQLYYQAKNMLENHEIKLLGISGEGEQYPGLKKQAVKRGINLVEINGIDHHRNFIPLVRSLHTLVEKFQPNIVHVRTNWQLALAIALKYCHRSKFMILSTIHGYRHNHPQKAVIAKYLIGLSLRMFADKVITPSSFLKNQFSILGDKRIVIPIGVDDEFFDITDIHFSVTGKKRIVFAGEFRKGKNQDMLIRALYRYIKDTGDEDVCMILPGEGPYRHQCEQLAVQLGVNNKVYLPGFLDRKSMLECYLNSQFVIVPSNSETFGHCVTEPFVLGLIVITRPVGVALDIIKNGKTGFIFNDEEELISILKLVIRNEALCTEISKAALLNRDYLRWSNVGRCYSKLLRDMMGDNPK
jgi:glycosyltransferase involved in cell wall biosynthesis